jgi:hypothetical protein
MRKTVLLLALVAVSMLLANLYGSEQTGTKNNEGLSREEKELSQRLEELEKKVESEDKADSQEIADPRRDLITLNANLAHLGDVPTCF